ncbi:MAG: hypothetical protein U9N31_09090 [Candidatus Marinimicrobia bacterium]|nr:hypothetical protein [Candidatus Neomarinimicrobiota bacterium]
MNRTLKTLFLLLFVSSVSFVYAQDRDNPGEKGGKSSVVKDAEKVDGGVEKTDGPHSVGVAKNTPTQSVNVGQPEGKVKGKKSAEDKKGWLARLFGKSKKAKKDDPN